MATEAENMLNWREACALLAFLQSGEHGDAARRAERQGARDQGAP